MPDKIMTQRRASASIRRTPVTPMDSAVRSFKWMARVPSIPPADPLENEEIPALTSATETSAGGAMSSGGCGSGVGVPLGCLETRVARTSSLTGATESNEVAIRRAARTSPSSILEAIRGARDLLSVAALGLTRRGDVDGIALEATAEVPKIAAALRMISARGVLRTERPQRGRFWPRRCRRAS